MTKRRLSILLLLVAVPLAAASAQINIPIPGTGGTIQLGPQVQDGPGQIYVTSATYGGNCGAQRGNLTQEMANTCGGRDFCAYRVDTRIVGDPRPGCPKDLRVSFTCREGTQERWASLNPEASGQIVHMDCRR